MSKTLTTAEAAALAGVQTQTIRRYCNQKRFKCGKWLGCWYIDPRSFRAWLRKPRKTGGNRQNAGLTTFVG